MYFHRYTFGTFAVVVITFFYSEFFLVFYTIINLLNECFIEYYITSNLFCFAVWKNKMASIDLNIKNRGIFGTYIVSDNIIFVHVYNEYV